MTTRTAYTEILRRAAAGLALAFALAIAFTGVAHAERAGRTARVELSPRQRARAAMLRQRGLEHFVRREYQLAADDLMEAYRIDRREATLLGWAEAVRGTGDCDLATRIYLHLLGKTTELKITRQAELGVAACEAAAPSPPTTAADPELVFGDAAPADPATDDAGAAVPAPGTIDEDVSLTDDPAPVVAAPVAAAPGNPHTTSYVVIGSGAFTAIAGLVTYASAGDGDLGPDANHAEVTSARSKGDWQRLIGASLAAVGGGVVLIGVVRYRRERRPRPSPTMAIGPYVSASGGGVMLRGGF